jgi:hypothetical protein
VVQEIKKKSTVGDERALLLAGRHKKKSFQKGKNLNLKL